MCGPLPVPPFATNLILLNSNTCEPLSNEDRTNGSKMEILGRGLIIIIVIITVLCANLIASDQVRCKSETQESNATRHLHESDLLLMHRSAPMKASLGRKKESSVDNPVMKLIPMLAMPFIIQTTFLPMMLLGIKFMLIQSIFLGKFAILFWLINLLRNNIEDQQGHLYSHNVHINHG